MVLKNMTIRKCYFLLVIIMAANMFAVNEMKAMNKGKKYKKIENINSEKSTTKNNPAIKTYKKKMKIKYVKIDKTGEGKDKKKWKNQK